MDDINNYLNRYKLRKANRNLYESKRRSGELDKYMPIKFNGMDKNQLFEKARSYFTKETLKVENPELYEFCRKNNYLYPIFYKQYYDIKSAADNQLLQIAKKYKNRTDCKTRNRTLENELRTRKLIPQAFPRLQYSVATCFDIAKEYDSRKFLWTQNRGVYDWLSKKKWGQISKEEQDVIRNLGFLEPYLKQTKLLQIVIPESKEKNTVYSLEKAIEFAKKFKTRTDLKEYDRSCYDLLNKENLLDVIFKDKKLVTIKQLHYLLGEI